MESGVWPQGTLPWSLLSVGLTPTQMGSTEEDGGAQGAQSRRPEVLDSSRCCLSGAGSVGK